MTIGPSQRSESVYKRAAILTFILSVLLLSACSPDESKLTFDISGTPNPLYYGGSCGTPVISFHVTGFMGKYLYYTYDPTVVYQLFDSAGKKILAGSLALTPVTMATPDAYNASQGITLPGSGASGSAPDSLVVDIGEGLLSFQAIIDAEIRTDPTNYGERTRYFTSTKSVSVLPCPPTSAYTIVPPRINITIVPPGSVDKPKPGSPPYCSVEPNNPNCIPGP
jgi:hypothetical protein